MNPGTAPTPAVTEAPAAADPVGAGTLLCPLPRCRAANDPQAETCRRCLTPLRAYARLRTHPARLFNAGLAAAREGRVASARDHFAAVVHWCPHDLEARSALALACLRTDDAEAARRHWRLVLDRRPNDATALRGLAALDVPMTETDPTPDAPEPATTPEETTLRESAPAGAAPPGPAPAGTDAVTEPETQGADGSPESEGRAPDSA